MKKILALLLLVFALFQANQLVAQQKKRCGNPEYIARLKQKDPGLEDKLRDAKLLMQQESLRQQNPGTSGVNTVITVPVVFHVLYNTPAENISQNRIMDQLATLNKDFARLNTDSNNTPVAFRSVAAHTNIQFCLAQRDPNGNSTNGIIRVPITVSGFDPLSNDDAQYTSAGGDDAWPRAQYLNIWVMTLIGQSGPPPGGDGILGITQPPYLGAPAATDGVIVLNTTVGGTTYHGTEPFYNLGRTLTHEVGHWFGLEHIWGDDGGTCGGSDGVSDTPNQADENYNCPSYPHTDACSPSAPGVMFMNYMDYVDDNCMNLFTNGQSTLMHSSITSFRSTIPSSNGCVAVIGIAELNSTILNLDVFPNPSYGSVTVSGEFTGNTDAVLTISNMLGEIVYSKALKNVSYVKLPVDLSGKSIGIYNLSLKTTHATLNRKIALTR